MCRELEAGRLTHKKAARLLWRLREEPSLTQEEWETIYVLDDAYDLALEGIWGTPAHVCAQIEEFLALYRAYGIVTWESWSQLDEAVDSAWPHPPLRG